MAKNDVDIVSDSKNQKASNHHHSIKCIKYAALDSVVAHELVCVYVLSAAFGYPCQLRYATQDSANIISENDSASSCHMMHKSLHCQSITF